MTRRVVQAVPNEILDIIFDNCCDTNLFSVADAKLVDSLEEIPALTLSSVCSQWRRVGLSSSRIWSRISLDLEGEFPPGEDQLSMILTIFISRSRQQPLALSICISDSPTPEYWCPYEPLAILCREYRRWSSFTFQCWSTFTFHDWTVDHLFRSADLDSSLPLEAFPVLVDLDLALGDSLSFFTVRAPSLQQLNLHQCSHQVWKSSLSPLDHVTHLRLDKIWSLFIQGTISELTGLHSLDVDDGMDVWDLIWLDSRGDEATPAACPSIEVLNVSHYEDRTFDSIFPYISLPSLRTLCLDCAQDFVETGHFWPSFNPFMAFVKRSSFLLTTLCIKCVAFSDSELIYLLYHIPTLLDLTVMGPNINYGEDEAMLTGRFLQSLHVGTSSLLQPTTPLVPRLRCLTINVGGYFFDDKAALDLVESRWAPHGSKYGIDCLRSFTIIFRARMNVPKAYDALNSFKKDGMKITVACKRYGFLWKARRACSLGS
ncbi:hypothetical protein BDP27DRAFT_1422727 [Rhodocollybia butyracea]|uniref:F-box domain-containing protein n=1 Tax=Rhodocollybia butyracea TaxID=206335 RepID=A0A9P5PQK6_9AGAR|nr:hypothetical protein BDP27DRAFT_1422727 [Rhodocollybia butyracea]